MSNDVDPSEHRRYERVFVEHVEKLLADDRLRIDTTRGRRPVTGFMKDVRQDDKTVELKRLMSEMNRPDRELQNQMPAGQSLEVVLSRKKWWFFKQPMGRLHVMCVSPVRALIAGDEPKPMTRAELVDLLSRTPPPKENVPITLVIMSTSGFAIEANELAERRMDRTVILAAPNEQGGWTTVGPTQTKALADLFDPEADAEKRRRVRTAIEEGRADLAGAGVAGDRVAARLQLPASLVESELKQYAKENPGLAAKRLDGTMVLFRQGSMENPIRTGGNAMPLIDRMKALFARKGETEKKIEFLAERRAALSQQRDRGYEEMNDLEQREGGLRQEFTTATGELTKRRITGQLLQLRKDIARRQQLLGVLNQQINVVATHLHNLELLRQGKTAQLPDGEEMAQDAAAAEEMIAELQANSELADTVGSSAGAGMSDEEQALYEELEQANKPTTTQSPASPQTESGPAKSSAIPGQTQPPQRRATPEPG